MSTPQLAGTGIGPSAPLDKRRRPADRASGLRFPLALVLVGSLLAACSSHSPSKQSPRPGPVVSSFLSDWAGRHWAAMATLSEQPPADLPTVNAGALADLGVMSAKYSAGEATIHGPRATVPVMESLRLRAVGPFTIHTILDLRLLQGHWRVEWSRATIDPALGAEGRFSVTFTWPRRAAILAANGTVLSPYSPSSVVVGVEGSYVKNATSLTAALVAAGAPASAVASAIAAAKRAPTTFEAVFTVPWARYEQLRTTLYPIPGVFFQGVGGASSSTPVDMVGVVGTLGTVTRAELKGLGTPYTSTSIVGQGGIEQADERRLAGSPGGRITVVSPAGTTEKTLYTFAATPGTPVLTTIDSSIETAAVNALAGVPNEAAFVAIQAPTGRIVAVANNSSGSDIALEGEQPPGSTMKVITSTALIDAGLSPSSPATCPAVINVDGENLHNDSTSETADSLLQAFTVSCNTAFIGLTMAHLNYSSLHGAAAFYNVGGRWNPGMPVFTGSVPVNVGQTDLAASAIGQSKVVVNPLDLAMVAADIDTSTIREPFLVQGAPDEHAPTSSVPASLDADLHEMMLSVVENGTAAGTGLPPGTYAKTGTAEYGSGTPLPIDAWLMGFNGDIAFAMIDVDAPGDGGPTDGPIVARFLDALS
ncbi:MAG TPA: penicillin-binding transpeptidase domain-containing protein [Acidimicrobiales bacterium]|nr:penicillin-binding transpeptidase domain-containing protein [Acidimicrobiales bacterium]